MIFARKYSLLIGGVDGAFSERQVINRVQQIGFAASIFSQKALYVSVEVKVRLPVILKINQT